MRKTLVLIFFLLCAGQAWGANCSTTIPADGSECGCTMATAGATYTLAGNVTCGGAGNCFIVGANNVTFDLGGYTINGSDTANAGVDVDGFTGVTIRNGTITHILVSGTDFHGASTGTVTDIVSSYSGNQAFQTRGTASVTYNNIQGNNCTDDGFSMHGGTAVINTGSFTANQNGINTTAQDSAVVLTGNNITITGTTGAAAQDLWFLKDVGGSHTVTLTNVVIDKTGGAHKLNFPIVKADGSDVTVVINGLTISNVPNDTGTVITGVYNGASLTYINANVAGNATSRPWGVITNQANTTFSWTGGSLSGVGIGIDHYGTGACNISGVTMSDITQNWIDYHTNGTVASTVKYNLLNGIANAKNGIVVRTGTTVTVANNTIIGSGTKKGTGLYWQGTATPNNNIYTNLAAGINTAVAKPTVTYEAFYSNTANGSGNNITLGTGCINGVDPLFLSSTDYHLQAGSPARGAATTTFSGTANVYDYAGTTRITDSAGSLVVIPDAGAYQSQPQSSAAGFGG